MFTGIVEETGVVTAFDRRADAFRLSVRADRVVRDVALGDSIAVDGCCLTVTRIDDDALSLDLLAESVARTRFSDLKPGDRLNLESSLRFNGKVGGHFVTGHIDAVGQVRRFEQRGADWFLEVEPPPAFSQYLVYKGSVAIDGVSLTVASVTDSTFNVWLIPHTLEVTNLSRLSSGKSVNLEFDLLAKYVQRLLPQSPASV